MVKTKRLKHPYLWLQSFFNSSTCNCFRGSVSVLSGKRTKLHHKHLKCSQNRNITTARARENKHTARMLANACKEHSISLLV